MGSFLGNLLDTVVPGAGQLLDNVAGGGGAAGSIKRDKIFKAIVAAHKSPFNDQQRASAMAAISEGFKYTDVDKMITPTRMRNMIRDFKFTGAELTGMGAGRYAAEGYNAAPASSAGSSSPLGNPNVSSAVAGGNATATASQSTVTSSSTGGIMGWLKSKWYIVVGAGVACYFILRKKKGGRRGW